MGRAATLVHALEEAAQVALLLVNPEGVEPQPDLSVVGCRESLPLAVGSLRGVLVGAWASSVLLPSLVRALRPRGRFVAPAPLTVPMDITELASDDLEWVGARLAVTTSLPVGLRRR